MGSAVIDSSVLIAALDQRDAHHEAAVEALRQARAASLQLVLPATALAESLVGASRLGPSAVRSTETFIDRVIDVVHPVDREVARSAAAYRARHSTLRLPDALVIAVGTVVDAETILTAHRKWSRVDRRVRVLPGDGVRERRRHNRSK